MAPGAIALMTLLTWRAHLAAPGTAHLGQAWASAVISA